MHGHGTTTRRRVAALLVPAIAIVIAAIVLPAGSARADSGRQCTADGEYGCASFKSDGDHFYVCDYAEDTHSVVVEYLYRTKSGRVTTGYAWNYLGPYKHGGCRRDTENHSGAMKRRTCLADYGKPGGVPGKQGIFWDTCGGWVKDSFGK